MPRTIHMTVDIAGALTWSDGDLVNLFSDEHGKAQPAKNIREYLREQLSLGRKRLPVGECDNFSYEEGCLGHPIGGPTTNTEAPSKESVLYSARARIATEVDRWLESAKAPPSTLNVLTALCAMGFLSATKPPSGGGDASPVSAIACLQQLNEDYRQRVEYYGSLAGGLGAADARAFNEARAILLDRLLKLLYPTEPDATELEVLK